MGTDSISTEQARKEALFLRESALEFMDILCLKDELAVDVGACKGVYTEKMIPHCLHVHAYEPLPDFAQHLRERFSGKNVTVYGKGLSDVSGKAVLSTPDYKDPDLLKHETLHTWSSIFKDFTNEQEEYPDRFIGVNRRLIEVGTLDEENLINVGLIKVDVEGAEVEVLRGAEKTLRQQQPVLLVELEERHRKGSISEAASYLSNLGYEGYFINGDTLSPLSEFTAETMQADKPFPHFRKTGRPHYNNFIFIPPRRKEVLAKIQKRLGETLDA